MKKFSFITLGLLLQTPVFAGEDYFYVTKLFSEVANHSIEPTPLGSQLASELEFRLLDQDQYEKVSAISTSGASTETSQKLWNWNLKKFSSHLSSRDLLDDIRAFYSGETFLKKAGQYSRPYPYPISWGELFHPPVREINIPAEKVLAPLAKTIPFANHDFSSSAFQTHLDVLTGHELTAGNKTTLLQNKDSYAEKLNMVKNAKHSIFISQLALACDPTSEPMIAELTQAIERGVEVRLLIDHLYSLIAKKCLAQFEGLGIKIIVVKADGWSPAKFIATTNHTSMWIIDAEAVIIGTQNLAEANNISTGLNFKDRDTDLEIQGPAATDALQEYIAVWNENSDSKDHTLVPYSAIIAQKMKDERAAGLRGQQNYALWFNQPKGLCRLAFQRPGRKNVGLSSLLIETLKKTHQLLQVTTTQIDTGKTDDLAQTIAALLRQLTLRENVRVDLIGNGLGGGNGELTMALNEETIAHYTKGHIFRSELLEYVNNGNALNKALLNHDHLLALSNPNLNTYSYFNFYHGKQWYFDRTALVVGSMNFDVQSFETHYEGAAMCLDSTLNQQFEGSLLLDLVNSVPVVN